ncbi:hypothetical protein CDIK_3209 [Cucumispora dikerogammari]|nr:hypothetical protein CDIK_3209 [Cucumispora dikerogammari]
MSIINTHSLKNIQLIIIFITYISSKATSATSAAESKPSFIIAIKAFFRKIPIWVYLAVLILLCVLAIVLIIFISRVIRKRRASAAQNQQNNTPFTPRSDSNSVKSKTDNIIQGVNKIQTLEASAVFDKKEREATNIPINIGITPNKGNDCVNSMDVLERDLNETKEVVNVQEADFEKKQNNNTGCVNKNTSIAYIMKEIVSVEILIQQRRYSNFIKKNLVDNNLVKINTYGIYSMKCFVGLVIFSTKNMPIINAARLKNKDDFSDKKNNQCCVSNENIDAEFSIVLVIVKVIQVRCFQLDSSSISYNNESSLTYMEVFILNVNFDKLTDITKMEERHKINHDVKNENEQHLNLTTQH